MSSSRSPSFLPIGGSTGLDNARDGTCEFHFGVMVGPDGCLICAPPIQALPMPAPRPRIIQDTPADGPTRPSAGVSLPGRHSLPPMRVEHELLSGPIELDGPHVAQSEGPRPILDATASVAHGHPYLPDQHWGGPTTMEEGDRA